MPVHHEKTDTPRRNPEGSSRRETSIHRTKQRELSVERRPIISQEKPSNVRQVSRELRKEKSIEKAPPTKSSSREVKKTSIDVNPAASKSSTSKAKAELLKIRSRVSENHEDKKSKQPANSTLKNGDKPSSKSVEIHKPKIMHSDSKSKSTSKVLKGSSNFATSKASEKIKRKDELKGTPRSDSKAKERAPQSVNIDEPKKHDRTKTRTLSPSEVKILIPSNKNNDNSTANTTVSAVLKNTEEVSRGSYNNNTEEVDVDGEGNTSNSSDNDENDDEYDDDFEDYESDFEEDSDPDAENSEEKSNTAREETVISSGSVEIASRKRIGVTSAEERERKLDSGSYHISTGPRKEEIEQIMMAMKTENHQPRKQSATVEDVDEGYLEGSIKTEMKRDDSKSNVLDFSKAGKRAKELEKFEKVRRRGEELSRMVTLDAITYTLMDIPAVPYDVFMATFGRSNTSQIHTQTNEDDCEEEVQTEDVSVTEKWTQAPAKFSPHVDKDGKKFYTFTKEEKNGVGGSDISKEIETFSTVNQQRLLKSMSNMSQTMLVWLESHHQATVLDNTKRNSELSCCDGMIITNETALKTPVKLVVSAMDNVFLTVQLLPSTESVIKIWNPLMPSTPIKTLICHQEITCACFSSGRGHLVIAGANDGSVNVWDLRDAESPQVNLSADITGCSPSYSTAEILKREGHTAAVVSLVIIKNNNENLDEFQPMQVCTLDVRGQVILWSVVQQSSAGKSVPNSDLGLAPWGRIRLIKSSSFVCSNILSKETGVETDTYTAMAPKGLSRNQLLIATSSGNILHCSTDGKLLKPKLFVPSGNYRPLGITAIATYEADQKYFLAGCTDGTIRLHSDRQDRPLINLHWNLVDATPTSSVKSLEWLPNRPCMFFALDATSRVHIWNLAVSDIYPQLILPASSNPYSFAGVLTSKKQLLGGSLIFGRENGAVEIHSLKIGSDQNIRINEWKKEMKMFQRYVKIL